jgi:hypothetical protein
LSEAEVPRWSLSQERVNFIVRVGRKASPYSKS